MTPRLSVVVPIYNVEEFLDPCLRSLADQTAHDLEVVMIDDGSTDDSPEVARAFADADERFVLVRQENAGLGAARNAGVRRATGAHLAFVDSDDVVPPDAYERMLAALERTGSDFATGNVHRLRVDGVQEQSPMFRRMMAEDRDATHVTEHWALIGDRIACNKVFRRDFWDRHGLAFPEGVLFEDTPVTVPAHFLASRVDVLSEPVYLWRDRDGSITNRRAQVRAVRDRTAAVLSASGFLGERAGQARAAKDPRSEALWREGKRRYDTSVLTGDLWLFMQALPHGEHAFHEAFLDRARAFAATVDPGVLAELPLALRVRWHLVQHAGIDELLAFMAYEKVNRGAFRVRGLLRKRAVFPGVVARTPRRVGGIGRPDLPLEARLTQASWGEDGTLRLKGFGYVRNLPAGRVGARARVAWLRAGKRRAVPVKLSTVRERAATYHSRQTLHSYDRSGFEAVVDPRKLVTGRASTTWNLEMAALAGGPVPRTGPVRMSGPCPLPVRYLGDFERIVPVLADGRLRLRVERLTARLTRHRVEDGGLWLEGELAPGAPTGPLVLRVENWRTKAAHDLTTETTGRTFRARVPLDAIATGDDVPDGQAEPWGVGLVRDGKWQALPTPVDTAPGHYGLGDGRELMVLANPNGNTELRDQPVRPVADTLTWADGQLHVAGDYARADAGERELVLVHSGHDEEAVAPLTLDGGRFEAVLRPHAVPGPAGTLPLAEGRWYLFLREPGDSDPERRLPVLVAPAAHSALPLSAHLGGRDFTVERRHHDRLLLVSHSALPEADRGTQAQAELRTRYAAWRAEPLRDAVLYTSFDGRQFSDSPRAVHSELLARGAEVEHLWAVRDQQVELPPGATPVTLWSAEWYAALARARHVVTNTHLPEWFERAEGQYVVQTWHGTPLKRIGRDLLGSVSADPKYIATLPARADQWSLLVSPNSFSTPVLRSAFGYTGSVLACGYPRNDVLHAPDRAKHAASVRDHLGIPEGRRVILYAPTWRENQPRRSGRYGLDLQLDLEAAGAALGDDHVLLVRRHYLVGGAVPTSDFVRDVSRHPDAAELLLIADVLVTDYSSMMFDFAQTGRPMLFHTYDLDHYRDTLRGFYFDFAAQAPGPLLRSSDEVIAALLDPDAAVAGHREAYARFREAFCDLDDGTAAAQVADAMLAHVADGGRR
ncbi:CDP-glycerol glycerophosphotransferase family protein [Streptomyces sp. KL116D]|uniref:CDP-glycerol glycerophosphotransferase family protein n=1 Tax=Streptomyces sp. KL116D TaxID=3045152 RepID=UPI003558E442